MISENRNGETSPAQLLKLQRRMTGMITGKTIRSVKFLSENEIMLTLRNGLRIYVDAKTALDVSIVGGPPPHARKKTK